MDSSKNAIRLIEVGIVVGVIIAWILFSVWGARPTGVNVGPIEFEIPTATTFALQPGLSCSFIDALLTKGEVLQRLESPKGTYAGVQIRLFYAVDVPAGWIINNSGQEYLCPCRFEAGTVASFWSPESCRPLKTR